MAEAVAAFYAVETAVEGAAVGAYFAAKPTVPLHVKFWKLRPLNTQSSNSLGHPSIGHTLNVIKGKAYIFGGDNINTEPRSTVKAITLPSSLDSEELDIRIIEPEVAPNRPLQSYSNKPTSQNNSEQAELEDTNQIPEPRSNHVSTSIGPDIFILGGRPAKTLENNAQPQAFPTDVLFPLNVVHRFSTQTSTWTTLKADSAACKDGIPSPRVKASCTSSSHPGPDSGIGISTIAHGTVFLHGGYDARGNLLRDTWSFDVSCQVWTRWPDIPDPLPQEIAGEGRIIYQDASLCRVGDGFGKVMYMDTEIPQGNIATSASGSHEAKVVLKAGSDEWEVILFGTSPDGKPLAQSESLPIPRINAGFLPITTGAGRQYNLYFMGQDGPGSLLNDVWTLQVKSQEKSGAAVKDKIREMVGRGTGENQWALCEVVQSTKDDGPLDIPSGMTDFAADTWQDLGGGNVFIWGGRRSDGTLDDGGWVLTAE